ncbi:MAG: flavin reductase family protein [Methyloprofundus sp.]|nr:flavin reductase family protein [Methyloprofundus sp.]
MSIDNQEFKNALKMWASGVAVVTANSEQGEQGMTVTSFTSVSMDPPQILVCLNGEAETGAIISSGDAFAVNVLSSEQEHVSNEFAGGSSMEERFKNVAWKKGALGLPVFDDALVGMECTLVEKVKAGSHWVLIGEIQNTQIKEGDPVLYFNSGYRQLASK